MLAGVNCHPNRQLAHCFEADIHSLTMEVTRSPQRWPQHHPHLSMHRQPHSNQNRTTKQSAALISHRGSVLFFFASTSMLMTVLAGYVYIVYTVHNFSTFYVAENSGNLMDKHQTRKGISHENRIENGIREKGQNYVRLRANVPSTSLSLSSTLHFPESLRIFSNHTLRTFYL